VVVDRQGPAILMNTPAPTPEPRGKRATVALVCVLALLAGVLGYRWWSARGQQVSSSGRPVSAFIVNWQCLACSHRIEQNAGRGPRPCPKCGREELYVVISWACPSHGGRPVFFQYNDQGEPSQVRMGDAGWVPAVDKEGGWNIRCPICKQVMMPAESPRSAD
jgi:hypothetical protein